MKLRKYRVFLRLKGHGQEFVMEAESAHAALRRLEAQYGPRQSGVVDYSVVEVQ